jgi:protein-L-isoaspartate O-methyltransferase
MSWDWYEANAAVVVPQYEAADPAALHAWLQDLLPSSPAAVLDVGAGSGRDAAWLAGGGQAC